MKEINKAVGYCDWWSGALFVYFNHPWV